MTQTAQLPFDVPESQLGPKIEINKGANGKIHRLVQRPLVVFKEFKTPVTPSPLRQLIQMRRQALRGEDIKSMTAWPTRVVIGDDRSELDRHNQAVGVLMPLIPDAFMTDILLPDGTVHRAPRDIQHLIYDPEVSRRRRIDVPADGDHRTRMLLCERLAFIVSVLNYQKIVYGDLSARNILYSLVPRPAVYLVDCDAARLNGEAGAVRQQNTPDWDPPEHSPTASGTHRHQSVDTDRYKLGLFMLRCLTPGRNSAANRDWTDAAALLDQAGRTLLKSALEGDPGDRPTAGTWNRYWRKRLGLEPVAPPGP